MDHYAQAYPIFSRIRGYRGYRKMLSSLRRFNRDEVAQQRLRIIEFYRRYGEQATKEAFGADRKVISRWRKKLNRHKGALEGLIPDSTRPKRTRTMIVPVEIIGFIRAIRQEHPRLGKEKIKPLLDEYCKCRGIKTIAESTIGKVIKRHKLFYQKAGRIYHDPSIKRPLKQKRIRVKRSPRHEDFGHIIADTVERVTDGVKDYFYNAIDAKLKFALTLNYKRLNSKNMKDFYERFKIVYPLQIKDWQTDNGSENLGDFETALRKANIPHLFIYPRCPKVNSIIERYNRTIQEEFIDNHLDIIHDKPLFHQHLAEYIVFYLTKRIHKSLDKMTPVDYLIKKGGMSHLYGTYTLCCRLAYLVVRYIQMRISGGTAKGRPTATPRLLKKTSDGERLRPTSSKVREALFDIIRSRIDGAGFVDLYAGTGTVGLEALSRGAGSAIFVEPDKLRADTISNNTVKFGFRDRAVVIRSYAAEFIAKASAKSERYDIYFIDPPYQSDEIEKVMPMIDEKELLSDNGLLIVEHFFKKKLPETFGRLKLLKQYKYGDTMLTLYGKVKI